MSERSTGSQYDANKVDGGGEQRRQQNEQSNQAGGQQGSAGGSLGAGPMSGAPSGDDGNGLADELNQGLAQTDGEQSTGPQRVQQAGGGRVERGGTANRPGDANGSGSAGSTRRDDPPQVPQR